MGVTVHLPFKLATFNLASKKCCMWLNCVGQTARAPWYTDRSRAALLRNEMALVALTEPGAHRPGGPTTGAHTATQTILLLSLQMLPGVLEVHTNCHTSNKPFHI